MHCAPRRDHLDSALDRLFLSIAARSVAAPAGAVGIPDRGTSYLSSRGALSPIRERPGHPPREEEFRAGRASRRNLSVRGGSSILAAYLRSDDTAVPVGAQQIFSVARESSI